VAAIGLAIAQQWLWAAGLFLGGYALQLVGHAIEGNQSGEEMLFRRLIGRQFSPQRHEGTKTDRDTETHSRGEQT
jgi:hypothetical protein